MATDQNVSDDENVDRTSHDRDMLFLKLADAIDQVFWFTEIDPERILYVSAAYEPLWKRKREDLYQDARLWMESIHPDDRNLVAARFEDWLHGTIPDYRIEYRIVRPDGTSRWIHDEGVQIRDDSGALSYVCGVAKDVTEEKEAKSGLELALQEITRLKDRLQQENLYLREEVENPAGMNEIVGDSDPLQVTLNKVQQVARTDASVLLFGETGTGKEQLAKMVHRCSLRQGAALVTVNCAALPGSLIESELFGHIKGAFTGALADKIGRFQLADKGTIFLDEIGELDLDVQSKLLRVLQEGEFQRIGTSETTKVDVRIVAATNRDLHAAVDEGSFRADLYYRLAVFPIEVPPLRARREDIPLLVWHFVTRKNARLGKQISEVPEKCMQALIAYDWPGNVRELENVIERAMILSAGTTLILDDRRNLIQRLAQSLSRGRPRNSKTLIETTFSACWKSATGRLRARGRRPNVWAWRPARCGTG